MLGQGNRQGIWSVRVFSPELWATNGGRPDNHWEHLASIGPDPLAWHHNHCLVYRVARGLQHRDHGTAALEEGNHDEGGGGEGGALRRGGGLRPRRPLPFEPEDTGGGEKSRLRSP